ncbi:MAG: polysaccharide deacetylase [Christensenellales bacterium]
MWYATNGEIFDYVEAFERLEWSVDRSTIFNPSATDVFLHLDGRDVLVPAGKTWKK